MGPRDKPLFLDRLDGSLAADIVSFIQKDTDRAVAAKNEKRAAKARQKAREQDPPRAGQDVPPSEAP